MLISTCEARFIPLFCSLLMAATILGNYLPYAFPILDGKADHTRGLRRILSPKGICKQQKLISCYLGMSIWYLNKCAGICS